MKTMTGKVVSVAMQKTIVVEVTRMQLHPLYKKYMKKTQRIKAHNENDQVKLGDTVILRETRPISKSTHYKVDSLVK